MGKTVGGGDMVGVVVEVLNREVEREVAAGFGERERERNKRERETERKKRE